MRSLSLTPFLLSASSVDCKTCFLLLKNLFGLYHPDAHIALTLFMSLIVCFSSCDETCRLHEKYFAMVQLLPFQASVFYIDKCPFESIIAARWWSCTIRNMHTQFLICKYIRKVSILPSQKRNNLLCLLLTKDWETSFAIFFCGNLIRVPIIWLVKSSTSQKFLVDKSPCIVSSTIKSNPAIWDSFVIRNIQFIYEEPLF